jgi:dihydroorotase
MLGLETALGIVMLAMGERFSWELAAQRMSYAPAEIGRLREQGRPLAVGAPANLTLIDPTARWTVDPMAMASRSRNTPYAGRELPAGVVATFLRGRATVLDGKAA